MTWSISDDGTIEQPVQDGDIKDILLSIANEAREMAKQQNEQNELEQLKHKLHPCFQAVRYLAGTE